MTGRRPEDENTGTEDAKGERAIVPPRPCSCCQVHDNRLWQPVPETKPRRSVQKKRIKKSLDVGAQLLPGLSDHVTLQLIVPKLSWKDIHALRCVSPAWQQAIQNHAVYESRVDSQLTEALVVVGHGQFPQCGYRHLSLYSPTDDTWRKLPRNQYLPKGILPDRQCVWLDGKLYVLGGIKKSRRESRHGIWHDIRIGSPKVYVLDLAGQGKWRICADMLTGRLKFGCGVMDGKIYVFGGTSRERPIRECEVYDPKVNTWSPIKSMLTSRFGHGVISAGKEFFLHGGEIYASLDSDAPQQSIFNTEIATSFEIYKPLNDEWRLIDSLDTKVLDDEKTTVIRSRRKLYLASKFGIDIYDFDEKEWISVQSFCPAECFGWSFLPYYSIVVGGERLALMDYCTIGVEHWRRCLMKSRLCTREEDSPWTECALSPVDLGFIESMWTIQM